MAFGALVALRDITLNLDQGEILGLIGPNGAGKTTVVNIISGFQRMSSGAVSVDGRPLDGLSPQARSRNGVVRTFQGARIFSSMTVLENAKVGALAQGASDREAEDRAHAALSRLGLRDLAGLPASRLTYGQERELDLVRALCTGPRYLLLDEPAAGMNESETASLKKAVRAIRDDFGIGVMLIEHDMSLVMSLCDRVQVLVKGETLTVGRPAEVQRNKDVLASYLGSAGGVVA
jgi:branched-chain amino acid transport system ATP-binding protein